MKTLAAAVLCALVMTACGSDTKPAPSSVAQSALTDRVEAIQSAITAWKSAADLTSVQVDAETARNLVVGPAGPGYGDTNGDGTIQGASEIGLLPGLHGEPGLIQAVPVTRCVDHDVLGGNWSDPADRWAAALTAVRNWTPTNNTFPTLPSHPQRIYGWGLARPRLVVVHRRQGLRVACATISTSRVPQSRKC